MLTLSELVYILAKVVHPHTFSVSQGIPADVCLLMLQLWSLSFAICR